HSFPTRRSSDLMLWLCATTSGGLSALKGWRSRLSRGEPPRSEVRIRQLRLMRRWPVAAPCLVRETCACRLVSSMALVAALPESKSVPRPRHSPSRKPIPVPPQVLVPRTPPGPCRVPPGAPDGRRGGRRGLVLRPPPRRKRSSPGVPSHPGGDLCLLVRAPLGRREPLVAAYGGPEGPGDQDDTDETGDDLVDLVLDGDQEDEREGADRVVRAVLQVDVVVEGALADQVDRQGPDVHGADTETQGHQDDVVGDGEGADHPVEGEGRVQHLEVEEHEERGLAGQGDRRAWLALSYGLLLLLVLAFLLLFELVLEEAGEPADDHVGDQTGDAGEHHRLGLVDMGAAVLVGVGGEGHGR